MDFNLSNEQRSWQMAARKFAEEEIRPISLERDAIPTADGPFDWEIIKKVPSSASAHWRCRKSGAATVPTS